MVACVSKYLPQMRRKPAQRTIDINQKDETHSLTSLYFDPLQEILFITIKRIKRLKSTLKSKKHISIGVNR